MSLISKLITAVTVIVLAIVVIGIFSAYATFAFLFVVFLKALSVFLGMVLFVAFLLGSWLAIIEINGRRQKHRRFAPTPEGYYEALPIGDGFIKPADNIILQLPHTYSPHITNPKQEKVPSQASDEDVIDLWQNGQTLRTIADATGKSYYQIQKITSREKKKKAD